MGIGTVKSAAHGQNQTNPDVRSLMLRAWLEPGASSRLRVRIVEIVRGLGERPVLATASVEEACRAVRRWLEAQEDDTQHEREVAPDDEP
jgi:hypothetical protein